MSWKGLPLSSIVAQSIPVTCIILASFKHGTPAPQKGEGDP